MTETLQQLDRRIESATELHSITRTMRGIAAVNLRHYELAALAVNDYEAIVEDGLHIALRDGAIERLPVERPAPDAPTALIAFGSNQGLCGPINRQVTAHTVAVVDRLTTPVELGAVGDRLAAELEHAGLHVDSTWNLPSTIEGIPPRAERVLVQTERWRRNSDVARLLLVFPHFLDRSRGYELITLQLLPTDREWLEWLAIRRWPSRVLPTYINIPWDQLIADLIRQALFVRLHRSFAQTMASVAASRLAAMDAAQRSIEERLSELEVRHHQLRQSEITKELLDVVSGFEVLQQTPDGR